MNEIAELSELQENAQKATSLLKVMANEWRLLILCHLAQEEHNVTDLENKLGLSQSALSQHLALLRSKKLVKTRRSAQSIIYSLDSEDVKALMETLYERFCA